ncbi:MAG: dihydroorotase [Adhaeribacter sp.]
MRTLFQGIKVIDPSSPFHNQTLNLVVEQGKIAYVGPDSPSCEEVIDVPGLSLSAGWVDMRCWVGDPGLEHKEDLASAAAAAARGGFTRVLLMPDVEPVSQSRNAMVYLQQQSQELAVSFLPAGAISVDAQGQDLTEMIDLHQAGALAFTDGQTGIQKADLMIKALQYAQYFQGLIIQRAQDERLSQHGLMHEGLASTQMGLKGIPALAEEVMVARDLKLLEYAGGKLHLSLISTAGAVALIREAKARGLQVSCDIASYQVAFTDEEIPAFDSNYKVNPPFRSEADRQALIQGLQDGTIDALVSGHHPQDTECKNLEFDLADFGIINLETAYAVANSYLAAKLSVEQLVDKLALAPRRILGLIPPRIAEGEVAEFTLFQPEEEWVPQAGSRASKSANSPFYGKALKGKVFGIFHKNQLVRNPEF